LNESFINPTWPLLSTVRPDVKIKILVFLSTNISSQVLLYSAQVVWTLLLILL